MNKIVAYHVDLQVAMWKPVFMEQMVCTIKNYGFNAILLEINDKFPFKQYPDLIHPDAPSRSTWQQFANFCQQQQITIIPLWQSIGHTKFVVGKARYAQLREAPELDTHYDPTSDAARTMICNCIDEIIELLQPQQFFHIGGDEVFDLATSERLAPLVAEKGKGAIYAEHISAIIEHLKRKNLTTILWQDMLMSYPEALNLISKDVVLADWDYSTNCKRPDTMRIWGHGDGITTDDSCNPIVNWYKYQQVAGPNFKATLEAYAIDQQTKQDGTFPYFYTTNALQKYGFSVITTAAASCYGDNIGMAKVKLHLLNCYHSACKGLNEAQGIMVTSWAVRHVHPIQDMTSLYAVKQALNGKAEADNIEILLSDFACETFGSEVDGKLFAQALLLGSEGYFRMHACFIERAIEVYNKNGEIILDQDLEALSSTYGGKAGVIDYYKKFRSDYIEAESALAKVIDQATKNQSLLAFWQEGINHNRLFIELAIAHAEDTLVNQQTALLKLLKQRQAETTELFATTYEKHSVKSEVKLRYQFFEILLNKE
jgi:hypothetical protein